MDKILSYLPDTVHIRIGIETYPTISDPFGYCEWYNYEIPKKWLKHGERGACNEWTIKKLYEKKFKEAVGEQVFHHYSYINAVLEWNQLQDIGIVLKKAKANGFDNILDIAKTIDLSDCKYFNSVLI